MSKYIIQTSRQPELTVAELLAKIPDIKFIERNFDNLLIESTQTIDQNLLNQLGTIPKIFKIITTPTESDLNDLKPFINSEQGTFALNWIPNRQFPNELKKQQLKDIKEALKESATSKIRFLNKGTNEVKDAYLLDQGIHRNKVDEYTIMRWHQDFLLLKTIAIQDINSYSFRDYNKPARDMERGMFPPKLAQLLINIATNSQTQPLIYDPFCGLGTVGMEASLQNIPSINSDIEEQAVHDTYTNLSWLNKKFKDSNENWVAFQADATSPKTDINWTKITAIVTEGFLGPIIKERINHEPDHVIELENLYKNFLKSFNKHLNKGSSIVFCLPTYRTNEGRLSFRKNIVENLENLGYIRQALIPEELIKKLELKVTERNTLLYMRSKQNVGREIIKVIKA